jgi:hypothetical protein
MKIQWLRVLLGGFLIEVILAVVLLGGFAVVGIDLAKGISTGVATIIGAGCFLAAFIVALWLGRGVVQGNTLHGFLMALVATVLYVALVAGAGQWSSALAGYGTVTFVIVNGLRLVGGALGGMLSQRQRRPVLA